MSVSKKDYYSILGIRRNATKTQIRAAYFGLAKEWHPDKWSTTRSIKEKQQAEKMFKEIGEAYGVLSDNNKKWYYDHSSDRPDYRDGKEGAEFECANCHNRSTYHYREIIRREIKFIFCSYLCLFDCTNPQCISGGKCYLKFIKPKTGGIFCENSCYWKFLKMEEEAKNSPSPGLNKNCFQCGRKFWQKDEKGKTVRWNPEEDKTKSFCSQECIGEWRKTQSRQNIEALRSQAINDINDLLLSEPEVTIKELEPSNQNWNTIIENATEIEEINTTKRAVLEDIRKKRATKLGKSKIITLLELAKTKNNFEELFSIIKQLKELMLNKNYGEYQAQIAEQEARLKKMDPQEYNKRISGSFGEQIKNHNLTTEELSAETIAAMEEAERTGDPLKVRVADELIATDGSLKCLNQLLAQVRQVQSKSEKQELLSELLIFIEENAFNKNAYGKKKSEVDEVVNQLIKETTEPTSSEDFPYLSVSLILIAVLVIGAGCFLIWKRKQRRF